jgi:hypothetical protein
LEGEGKVELILYNLLGEVKKVLYSGYQYKGKHSVKLDGTDLASGIYIYSLRINGYIQSKLISLTK